MSQTTDAELLSSDIQEYIANHGNTEKFRCRICDGNGWTVKKDADGNDIATKCVCVEILRMHSLIDLSGLKDQMESCTFDSYEAKNQWQERVKHTAQRYAANPDGKWFFVGGQVGSGKTHICAAIVGELLKKGQASRYMKWVDDISELRRLSSFRETDQEEYNRSMEKWKHTKVLYIDDFFKGGRPDQKELALAFEILNERYNKKDLLTIISSEMQSTEIMGIDEAIGSRIIQRSGGASEFLLNIKRESDRNYRISGGK